MQSTPYDDVFRTLLNDCRQLILPVLNEAFGESYRGDEEIVFSPNEHFLNRQDGEEPERITDTSFKVLGTKEKKYHWECQSRPDSSMLVRIFEYDAQIALDCHPANYLEPFSSVYLNVLSGPNSVMVRLNGGYSA